MTMTLDDYHDKIENRLIADIALAIANKLSKNGISISLSFGEEIANDVIKLIKNGS